MNYILDKWNYFWGGLTKRGKIVFIAAVIILAVIAWGQF
jgi:hypothetical protein|tara:strand:- start:50 stop:166 length:117 start_codon:yes stop_codon:yes gene_type:complete